MRAFLRLQGWFRTDLGFAAGVFPAALAALAPGAASGFPGGEPSLLVDSAAAGAVIFAAAGPL